MRWTYTLDPYEMRVATGVGKIRRSDNDGTTQLDSPLTDDQREVSDILAVRSEIAVSRMLNLCWTGMGRKQPDVGGFIEVRVIDSPKKNLVIRVADKDDSPCVLVLVEERVCTALCWAYPSRARDIGKRMGSNKFPYFLIFREDCNQMDELQSIIDNRRVECV